MNPDHPEHTVTPSNWELIDRYLAGECSPEEAKQAQTLLADPQVGALVSEAQAALNAGRPSSDEAIRALAAIHTRMDEDNKVIPLPRKVSQPKTSPPWFGYAAVAGCVLLLGVYLPPRLSLLNRQSAAPEQFKEYTTAPGQRATVTLKDGTQILLNVASRMRVASDYGKNSRIIDLNGEAQFTVTHDPKRPFLIRANGTLVRDLATTFVVRAYPGTSVTRVAVRDGRVSVQPPAVSSTNALVVDAGNAAIVSSESEAVVSAIENNGMYFGWTDGQLVLDDAHLHQALIELSRWYNLDFRVSDSAMLAKRITGTFPQSLNSEGMRAIADIIHARVERVGTTVIFHPQANNTNLTRPE